MCCEKGMLPGLVQFPGDSAETENLTGQGVNPPADKLVIKHTVLQVSITVVGTFWLQLTINLLIKLTHWPSFSHPTTDSNKLQAHKSCKTLSINEKTKMTFSFVFNFTLLLPDSDTNTQSRRKPAIIRQRVETDMLPWWLSVLAEGPHFRLCPFHPSVEEVTGKYRGRPGDKRHQGVALWHNGV